MQANRLQQLAETAEKLKNYTGFVHILAGDLCELVRLAEIAAMLEAKVEATEAEIKAAAAKRAADAKKAKDKKSESESAK